jgi:hypothetical protein
MDDREVGVQVPIRLRILFSHVIETVLAPTQSPIQWITGAFSPEVKQSGLEADHSPPTSVEVKKTRVYTSTPSYDFMG